MTKVICIDSFKPSYLEYAPFLSSLTKKYQYGKLKVPTGFWGGMETFFKGESNTLAFYYHSNDSSLRWTKRFTFLGRRILEIIINLQRLFRNQRQFFLTHNIPLKELYKFESAVKREFTQDADCDYIHIGELDGIAHKHGTKAKETINCRCRTVTIHPEIGKIASPLDERVEKEKERRGEAWEVRMFEWHVGRFLR